MELTGTFRDTPDNVIATARLYERWTPRRNRKPILSVDYQLPPWFRRSPKWNITPNRMDREVETTATYPAFTAQQRTRFDFMIYKIMKKTLAAWDNAEGETRENMLPELRIVASFQPLAGAAKRRLQTYYLTRSDHWEKWDMARQPQEIDPYTGVDDDAGYEVVEAGGYIRYEDGEVLGYDQLRWLLDILEAKEGPHDGPVTERIVKHGRIVATKTYTAEEANSAWGAANTLVGDEPTDPAHYEDRGYEPPTFTPALEENPDNVEAFIRENHTRIDAIVQAMFNNMVTAQTTYSRQRLQYRTNIQRAHTRRERRLAQAQEPREPDVWIDDDLPRLLSVSYLSEAERYMLIRRVAAMIRRLVPDWAEKALKHGPENQRVDALRQFGLVLRYWDIVNEATEVCDLTEFVELFFDELHDRDATEHRLATSDTEIAATAERTIEEVVNAPVARRLLTGTEFPSQEKLALTQTGPWQYARLKDPADWQTLQQIYQHVGIDIDPKLIHTHTPYFQRCVIEGINEGMGVSQAYGQAWARYRARLAERRAERQRPGREFELLDYENQRFIVPAGNKTATLHPAAIQKVAIVPSEQTRRALEKALNSGDHAYMKAIKQVYNRLIAT